MNRLKALLGFGNWTFDIKSNEFSWSKEVVKILDLEGKSENPNDKIRALFSPNDWDRLVQNVNQLKNSDAKLDLVLSCQTPKNKLVWVRFLAVKDEKSETILGGILNVTDLKAREIELDDSRKYLQLAIAGTNLGIWDWYLKDNSVQFDRGWAEMLGLKWEEIDMHLDTWQTRVHPDDLAPCFADIKAYMDGKTPFYRNVHRMRHANGEWVYILDQGKFSDFDENGNPTRFTGTHLDVTESKKRELRERYVSEIRNGYLQFKNNRKSLFDYLLSKLIEITESEYGFIGEIRKSKDGQPYLKTYALTDISWNEQTKVHYEKFAHEGLEFHNLNTLFGQVIQSGQELITNDPKSHPKAHGVPPGHPDLKAFMGVPLFHSSQYIGMVGLANRPNGFSEQLFHELNLIFMTVAQIIWQFQIEQNVARERDTFDMVLRETQTGVWTFNPTTQELVWDKSMYSLYDLDPQKFQVSLQSWQQFIHPEDRERLAKSFKGYLEATTNHFKETFRVFVKGEICHYRVRIQKLKSADGRLRSLIGVNWDVSDEVRVQTELEVQKEISSRNARMATVGMLAAGVAHEVNNPLSIIKGYVDILDEKMAAPQIDPVQVAVILEKIKSASQRIEKVVGGLRSFSRHESDSRQIAQLSIYEVLESTVELVRGVYEKDGITMEIHWSGPRDLAVKASKGQLQQIMLNLISNAYDAVMKTEKRVIRIEVSSQSNHCHLSVSDSGSGVAVEIRDRIFDPFFTTKDIDQGSGIGLSIVHNFVKDLSGEIQYSESDLGGARFEVKFPLYREGESSRAPAISKSHKIENETKLCLLVEDELDLHDVIKEMLEPHDISVISAYNGQEGFELLKSNIAKIDFIISDYKMPGLKGSELKEKARSLDPNGRIPWIFITGALEGDKDKIPEEMLTAVKVIYKPFGSRDLEEALNLLPLKTDRTRVA